MKTFILKLLLRKNGFYCRERLYNLSQSSLLNLLYLKAYRFCFKKRFEKIEQVDKGIEVWQRMSANHQISKY